jgi:hypothetical protein
MMVSNSTETMLIVIGGEYLRPRCPLILNTGAYQNCFIVLNAIGLVLADKGLQYFY